MTANFPDITPSHLSRLAITASVIEVRFGAGRTQRTKPAKLRHDWSLIFAERSRADITRLDRFLTARAGAEPFRWAAPDQGTRLFICQHWEIIPISHALASLTAQLSEVE